MATIPGLTVVTNSTAVADAIGSSDGAKQTVILTGGVRTPSAALVGPVADATIRSLHFDQLFLGVHGMDAVAGFTTPNLAEAETNRSLIERAQVVIVVADSSKWATVGLADFGPLSTADILITDDGLPDEARARTERGGRRAHRGARRRGRRHSHDPPAAPRPSPTAGTCSTTTWPKGSTGRPPTPGSCPQPPPRPRSAGTRCSASGR